MITANPKCTHTIMSFLKHLSDDRHCKKVACHSEVREVQEQEQLTLLSSHRPSTTSCAGWCVSGTWGTQTHSSGRNRCPSTRRRVGQRTSSPRAPSPTPSSASSPKAPRLRRLQWLRRRLTWWEDSNPRCHKIAQAKPTRDKNCCNTIKQKILSYCSIIGIKWLTTDTSHGHTTTKMTWRHVYFPQQFKSVLGHKMSPKGESIQMPHARPCLKTTWGNLTHDNNDGDDDPIILIACFNATIVACWKEWQAVIFMGNDNLSAKYLITHANMHMSE